MSDNPRLQRITTGYGGATFCRGVGGRSQAANNTVMKFPYSAVFLGSSERALWLQAKMEDLYGPSFGECRLMNCPVADIDERCTREYRRIYPMRHPNWGTLRKEEPPFSYDHSHFGNWAIMRHKRGKRYTLWAWKQEQVDQGMALLAAHELGILS